MIESLHSPHIARVKALIGSRGNKERAETGLFVAEGLQSVREALTSKGGPEIDSLYLTNSGLIKLGDYDLAEVNVIEVSDEVMAEMASTVTPQGILAVCAIPQSKISSLTALAAKKSSRIIYLHEIQDPGNAGTILRTADAMGVDAVITSPSSVDMYSPKVVRATAGSHWHIPLFQSVQFKDLSAAFPDSKAILLSSHATTSVLELDRDFSYISIFGNEARGVDAEALGVKPFSITAVTIPMAGRAESLNLSAAASIVMFTLSHGLAG
jgi:TrmH family RNA methyltransferase